MRRFLGHHIFSSLTRRILILNLAGLGVLVSRSPVAFEMVRWAGVAYLMYLGLRLILAAPQPEAETTATAPEGPWSMFRRGLWVNLLNPKAIVFFLAFIPGFINTGAPLVPQYAVTIGTIVAVDIAVMWLFFAVVARGFRRISAGPRGQRRLGRIFGTLFIGVGGLLAFS